MAVVTLAEAETSGSTVTPRFRASSPRFTKVAAGPPMKQVYWDLDRAPISTAKLPTATGPSSRGNVVSYSSTEGVRSKLTSRDPELGESAGGVNWSCPSTRFSAATVPTTVKPAPTGDSYAEIRGHTPSRAEAFDTNSASVASYSPSAKNSVKPGPASSMMASSSGKLSCPNGAFTYTRAESSESRSATTVTFTWWAVLAIAVWAPPWRKLTCGSISAVEEKLYSVRMLGIDATLPGTPTAAGA
mmetsp:Transcript_53096/g.126938  ORF Transcript_53096/g.126938 Transcript_53096/m.126938 type:complete len:244 (+) Transcript_53096:1057-1788(+)